MQTNIPPVQNGIIDSSCGPWGITLQDQLRTQSELNASFSQHAWADAQLSGCLPRTCNPLPKWPPPPGEGFIYPTLEKKQQELLDLGVATGCPGIYNLEMPYASGDSLTIQAAAQRRPPVIDVKNPNECPPSTRLSGDMAGRVAAKILGLPPPSHSQAQAATEVFSDASAPGPAPSPGPYYKEQCILDDRKFHLTEVLPCTWNTVEGIVYDIRHWKQLPRDSTTSKLGYVLGRDDRPFYLAIAAFVVIAVVLLVRAMTKKRSSLPAASPYGYGLAPQVEYVAVPLSALPAGMQAVPLVK